MYLTLECFLPILPNLGLDSLLLYQNPILLDSFNYFPTHSLGALYYLIMQGIHREEFLLLLKPFLSMRITLHVRHIW